MAGTFSIKTAILSGEIQGEVAFDINQRPYFSFIGVPYARIGGIFQHCQKIIDPVRHNDGKWVHTLRCCRESIQDGDHSPFRVLKEDDLPGEISLHAKYLFLNIYTPALPCVTVFEKFLPIMVFLPGDHYYNNYNKTQFYNPKYLVAEDVIVVIVHFRTGILGFMYNGYVEGNVGLGDILWALKWVQTNGNYFTGDTNNVTIWGQGMGSVLVSCLLACQDSLRSVQEEGICVGAKYNYFHRAIMQSGSFENSWGLGKNNIVEYAQRHNIPDPQGPNLLRNLIKINIRDLVEPQQNYFREFNASAKPLFGPLVIFGQTMLHVTPEELLITNHLTEPIPIMLGFNSSEGFIANIINPMVEYDIAVYRPHPQATDPINIQTCQNYYESNIPNIGGLYRMITDICFVRGMLKMLKLLKHPPHMPQGTRIYLYKFSCDDPKLNVMKAGLPNRNPYFQYSGACHGDELGYLFKTPLSPDILTRSQLRAIKKMVRRWTNFAKTGVPYGNPETQVLWYPVPREQEGKVPYLNIAENDQMMAFENTFFLDSLTSTIPY